MHQECFEYVARTLPIDITKKTKIVEFGSCDVNGTVRPLIGQAEYIGIDLVAGPNVDIVMDCREYLGHADIVLCLEVVEHEKDLDGVIQTIVDTMEPEGLALITCATNPRPPHSAVDGGPVRTGEWYKNISPSAMRKAVKTAGAKIESIEVDKESGDLRVKLTHG